MVTKAEQDASAEAAKQAEKDAKAKEKAQKASWDLFGSFAQLAAQALASSNSIKELGDNLARAGVQWISQMAQNMIGGPLGTLLGGVVQFAGNVLLNREQQLPIKDGALETRVVNLNEMNLQYSAVRDRGEMAFSRHRREEWSAAANGG